MADQKKPPAGERTDYGAHDIQWMVPPDKVTPQQKDAVIQTEQERVAATSELMSRLRKAAGTDKVKQAVKKALRSRKKSD